jgi:hypothetical protein
MRHRLQKDNNNEGLEFPAINPKQEPSPPVARLNPQPIQQTQINPMMQPAAPPSFYPNMPMMYGYQVPMSPPMYPTYGPMNTFNPGNAIMVNDQSANIAPNLNNSNNSTLERDTSIIISKIISIL